MWIRALITTDSNLRRCVRRSNAMYLILLEYKSLRHSVDISRLNHHLNSVFTARSNISLLTFHLFPSPSICVSLSLPFSLSPARPWLLLQVQVHLYMSPTSRPNPILTRSTNISPGHKQPSLITDVGKTVLKLEEGLGLTAIEDELDKLFCGELSKVCLHPPDYTQV